MALNNAYAQYKENTVYTARPEELTLMLYNGLVKFVMQAQQGLGERNIEKTNNSIIRAQDILLEFEATLNKKYTISHNLSLIYDYMNRRLIEANIKKDDIILEEVLGISKELRDTWEQAIKIARQRNKVPPVAE